MDKDSGRNYAKKDRQTESLTPRELEVLSLFVRGFGDGQIAAELQLSIRTVYAHFAIIEQKLDLSSRAELLAYIREHKLR